MTDLRKPWMYVRFPIRTPNVSIFIPRLNLMVFRNSTFTCALPSSCDSKMVFCGRTISIASWSTSSLSQRTAGQMMILKWCSHRPFNTRVSFHKRQNISIIKRVTFTKPIPFLQLLSLLAVLAYFTARRQILSFLP